MVKIAGPCPSGYPTVHDVCRGVTLVSRVIYGFSWAILVINPRDIVGVSPYLTLSEARDARMLSSLMLLSGMAGLLGGEFARVLRNGGPVRRFFALMALVEAAISVCMSGNFFVLACAAWGARLSHEAAVAAYGLTGVVVGAGALLGFLGIVWGEEDS